MIYLFNAEDVLGKYQLPLGFQLHIVPQLDRYHSAFHVLLQVDPFQFQVTQAFREMADHQKPFHQIHEY